MSLLVEAAIDAVVAGGEAVMSVRGCAVSWKADGSPVTDGDRFADEAIRRILRRADPGTPIISEESGGTVPDYGAFWLVDPLDGTKEFVAGVPEFTVNVALVTDGHPGLGVIFAPATGELFAGAAGRGACRNRQPISVRPPPPGGSLVLTSRSHCNEATVRSWLHPGTGARLECCGSSLKFCRIAQGSADLYPRFGPTMEWDTAAGQAVLEAAGGSVRTLEGAPLGYGKEGLRNPSFVASGSCLDPSSPPS